MSRFFSSPNDSGSPNIPTSNGGVSRTSGNSPQPIGSGVSQGFTPNSFYDFITTSELYVPSGSNNFNSGWAGNQTANTFIDTDTNSRFKLISEWVESSGPLPTRNYYSIFNDTSTDFFKHGLHIDDRTNVKTNNDYLHGNDGSNPDEQNPYGLGSFVESSYENSDPVMFGFEIVMHGQTSPLFNGGVEDFIGQFGPLISEVQSRTDVISNFKQQFFKFFKSDSQTTNTGTDIKSAQSYLGYYLKKVSGLENLVESNTSDKHKSFVDYKKDIIKLSFTEDVSLSLGSMASLYKLLYWSRINGKNVIPQNLLRFDCDIIVTEVRNFSRVKKALNGGNGVQMLKENLSRYVYSLYECQMFFDKMPHDGDIDLGAAPKTFDNYEISFNYKFSSMKFQKWVPKYEALSNSFSGKPDPKYSGGGQYVYLSNDRMNPFQVKTNETTNVNAGNDTIVASGQQPINTLLQSFYLSDKTTTAGPDAQNPENQDSIDSFLASSNSPGSTSNSMASSPSSLQQFKMNSEAAAKNLAKNVANSAIAEVNNSISIRARLLSNTINKITSALGIGALSPPTNVYIPSSGSSLATRFFYDVRGDLRTFLGESLGGALGG
jgi:hypothetical protein